MCPILRSTRHSYRFVFRVAWNSTSSNSPTGPPPRRRAECPQSSSTSPRQCAPRSIVGPASHRTVRPRKFAAQSRRERVRQVRSCGGSPRLAISSRSPIVRLANADLSACTEMHGPPRRQFLVGHSPRVREQDDSGKYVGVRRDSKSGIRSMAKALINVELSSIHFVSGRASAVIGSPFPQIA